MKQHALALTDNVEQANNLVNSLKDRPKTEMVGLGLIYGNAGLGKSRFAFKYCVDNVNSIYFRLDASMSLKSFLESLFNELCKYYAVPTVRYRRTVAGYFEQVLNFLQYNPDIVLFIDEIDYSFKNLKMLSCIRDFVDKSLATVILVGMETAKQSLLASDSHYFDRCNFFSEFKAITLDDAKKTILALSEYDFDDAVIDYIFKTCKGNLRKLVKAVHVFESLAKQHNLTAITASMLQS